MNASSHRQQATDRRGLAGRLTLLGAALITPPALLGIEAVLAGRPLLSATLLQASVGWAAAWCAGSAWWLARLRREPPLGEPQAPAAAPTALPEATDSQLSAASVLELVNQQWVTPLGHIRSAVDTLATMERRLARCAPPGDGQPEPARSLQLMRHASHRLRISIENIIDYHEITAGRMTRTDSRVNLRTTGEDLVTDWQTTAQREGQVLQFIGYQDLPREIAFDPQMLRRLLDRLLNEVLGIAQLREPAVTLELEDEQENDGGDRIGQFRLTVDGEGGGPDALDAEALTRRLEQTLPQTLEGLLADDLIDIWIIRCIGSQLDSTLQVVADEAGRLGLEATFSAPVLLGEADSGDRLAGQLCGVLCTSTQHRRAWQGNLAALGANLQIEPDFGQPVDLLFLDERIVAQNQDDPAFEQWVALAGRVIGLSSHLTIRGRPSAPLHWADFTLPLFIRARALSASLGRVLGTPAPGPRRRPATASTPPAPTQPTRSAGASTPVERKTTGPRHALYSFAGRTALVIDDDPVYLAHLGQTLGELGFQVLSATNGKQALSLADHEDIDIVFTDMHMPDITGAGVARILKKRPRHLETPIIAITANRQGNVHQDLLHSGIERVLTKPVTAGDLLSAIGEFFPLQTVDAAERQPDTEQAEKPAPDDGRDPFLTRLLCDELPGYRRLLAQQPDDQDALRHAAHKLRGAAACCQEGELQRLAGELEGSLDGSASSAEIQPLIGALIERIDQINAAPTCSAESK